MSETVFQQQNNIFQDYDYNTDLLPSEVTWNEMNSLQATSIEKQISRDGGIMRVGGTPPPTKDSPISDSIIPLLVMVAGLFVVKYIKRMITRTKPENNI